MTISVGFRDIDEIFFRLDHAERWIRLPAWVGISYKCSKVIVALKRIVFELEALYRQMNGQTDKSRCCLMPSTYMARCSKLQHAL